MNSLLVSRPLLDLRLTYRDVILRPVGEPTVDKLAAMLLDVFEFDPRATRRWARPVRESSPLH